MVCIITYKYIKYIQQIFEAEAMRLVEFSIICWIMHELFELVSSASANGNARWLCTCVLGQNSIWNSDETCVALPKKGLSEIREIRENNRYTRKKVT